MSTPKLPKGLPKLPPVPDGYDAWKLCGWGKLNHHQTHGRPWNSCSATSGEWPPTNAGSGMPSGFRDRYYILAVKRPAKTPKHARKGRVVARMSKQFAGAINDDFSLIGGAVPVAILPADAESVERMVEQVKTVFFRNPPISPTFGAGDMARAVLAAIGIASKENGGKS